MPIPVGNSIKSGGTGGPRGQELLNAVHKALERNRASREGDARLRRHHAWHSDEHVRSHGTDRTEYRSRYLA